MRLVELLKHRASFRLFTTLANYDCKIVNMTAWRCSVLENNHHRTFAKFINKSSLFILLPRIIRRAETEVE